MQLLTFLLEKPVIFLLASERIIQCLTIKTKANVVQHWTSGHSFESRHNSFLPETEVPSLWSVNFVFCEIAVVANPLKSVVSAGGLKPEGLNSTIDRHYLDTLQVIIVSQFEFFIHGNFHVPNLVACSKRFLYLIKHIPVVDLWQVEAGAFQIFLFKLVKAKKHCIYILVSFFFGFLETRECMIWFRVQEWI